MTGGPPAEPRETSGATTAGLLGYVQTTGGAAAVGEVLRRSALPWSAADLCDQSRWWSYDTRIRLFTAATEVLDDPDTMVKVGSSALQSGLAHSVILLVRTLGSPRQVIRHLPRAIAKFSTTSTMHVHEAGPTSARVAQRLRPGYVPSRLDCRLTEGVLTTVPTIFGLPPARVIQESCQSDGHPACVFRLTWERPLRRWRRSRPSGVDAELTALRGQPRALQSVAADLAASDDLVTVLHRIVARAGEAVLAPAYLLAVDDPRGGAPFVHGVGIPDDQVPGMAARLLDDGHLGPGAVVVDVVSARRWHGRLAALYRHGSSVLGEEQAMLAAYAGHAASALDLLLALQEARLEAHRAGALLSLAHELAIASGADAVCSVVAEALPRIVGCSGSAMLLWDPAGGRLQTRAAVGFSEEQRQLMLSTPLTPEEVPELVRMLTDREPRVVGSAGSSTALAGFLRALDLSDVVAVPLLAGSTFLGVATASWRDGEAPGELRGDVLARLRGVGHQAAAGLQKARLLEKVRHQASHDPLTGLPNRVLVLERLEAAVDAAAPGGRVAVLFCDLDLFKEVNDSLGHAAGDELLRQVAARLRTVLRPGDLVGRLSGDEFAVVLSDVAGPEEAQVVVDRISACFARPFRLEGTEVSLGTSVGVALHEGPGGAVEQLLRQADAAMYRAKQRDRAAAGRG